MGLRCVCSVICVCGRYGDGVVLALLGLHFTGVCNQWENGVAHMWFGCKAVIMRM